jgi:hypothetical protein
MYFLVIFYHQHRHELGRTGLNCLLLTNLVQVISPFLFRSAESLFQNDPKHFVNYGWNQFFFQINHWTARTRLIIRASDCHINCCLSETVNREEVGKEDVEISEVSVQRLMEAFERVYWGLSQATEWQVSRTVPQTHEGHIIQGTVTHKTPGHLISTTYTIRIKCQTK